MWPLSSDECYVSVDVETDDPIPALHSMLSLGAAAYDSDGRRLDTFSANLQPLAGATEHLRTMRWWAAHLEAWEACHVDPQPPERAIAAFRRWLNEHHKHTGWPVLVAFPVMYDGMWVEWYLHRFGGESPFRRRGLDIKTVALVAMGAGYQASAKATLPKHWRPNTPHTHIAVDDAIEQGELLFNVLRELNAQRGDISLAAGEASAVQDDYPALRSQSRICGSPAPQILHESMRTCAPLQASRCLP